ncbi:MAG: MFS transporter, partial [Caldilineaceae bacterium]|nr:MFS transporter [Caldilineaceae bacterium]
EQGVPWRWTMAATGLIWLAYGAGALLLVRRISPSTASPAVPAPPAAGEPVRAQDPEQKKTPKGGVMASIFSSVWDELQDVLTANLGMLRNVGFLSLFLIAFIYNGVAFSLLGWVALFMQESAGFSTFSSISMISVFYVALTAGRFLCAAYAERLGYAATLLILAAGLVLTYPLVIFSTTAAPLVIGVLNVAMTIGTMLPPLWTAIFSDLWSFQTALGINYTMALLLLAVCLYLTRLEPRTARSEK